MLNSIQKLPGIFVYPIAFWLAFKPIFPEPHLFGQIVDLLDGNLYTNEDIAHMALHVVVVAFILVKAWVDVKARITKPEASDDQA